MIATNTITIEAPEQSIILAPFGESHIQSVLPVPDSLLQYEPAAFVPYVKGQDPKKYMQGERDVAGALTWGIFSPETTGGQQTPEAFLGTIALYDNVEGNTQEVATNIFRPGCEGRGFGTLAKLGVVHFAFSRGMASINGESAASNYPAHRSLEKSGFVQVGVSSEQYALANGKTEPMTQWLLRNERASAGSLSPEISNRLALGHQTYLQAVSRLIIQYD